jgi:uncharacterized protein (DUF433 family)
MVNGGESAMIISDPKVMMGKPVVAGTRITVELILEKLDSGETIREIMDSHPRLSPGGRGGGDEAAFARGALKGRKDTM